MQLKHAFALGRKIKIAKEIKGKTDYGSKFGSSKILLDGSNCALHLCSTECRSRSPVPWLEWILVFVWVSKVIPLVFFFILVG